MADVSKIQIGSTTYNIKDSTARTDLAGKAPIASPTFTGVPSGPTAAVSSNTTQFATTEFVQKHAPIYLSVTAQEGTTVTKNDSRITPSMHVVNCYFSHPYNVTSNVGWATYAGSITFTGTFSGSTTINCILMETN